MLATRSVVVSICSAVVMALTTGKASSQKYPDKPIRIIATELGGAGDLLSRLVAQGISDPLGQPVIVDNRVALLIGEMVARSTPDGYTIGIASAITWVTPFIQKTNYDPVKDFSPVTLMSMAPNVLLVHPSLPVKSVKELVALAKARPGELNYASGPTGAESHLAGVLFKALAGINIVRVPYKGSGPGVTALLANEVQMMFSNVVVAVPQLKSGKLRGLAVTGAEPTALVPGLPPVAAAGLPGYEMVSTVGLVAPAGTPVPIINRLNQEIVRVLNKTEVKEKTFNSGLEIVGSSPAQFAAKIKSETAKWGKVIKEAGIKAD